MRRRPSRRGFLAAAGASSIALAGCTGLSGIDSSSGSGSTATPTDTGTEQSNTTPQATTNSGGPGTLVEDFENPQRWASIKKTKFEADTNTVYAGSKSLRLENPSGGVAGVYKAFPDGLDLSNDDLSFALKLEKPTPAKVAVVLRAPGSANQIVGKRFVSEGLTDWFRVDVGYTDKTGNPNMKSVQEVRIMVFGGNKPIRFWIDDLRKTPKPDTGKVILSFDDEHISAFDVAFQQLKNRNWPGTVATIPWIIGSTNRISMGQLRTMRDAGWDIASQPQRKKPLTEYDKDQQRSIVKQSKTFLTDKGFPDGAKIFFAPFGKMNADTLSVVSDLHDLGFTFGASPGAAPPTGKYTISEYNGSDPKGVSRLLTLTADYRQLSTINFGPIGPNADTTLDQFNTILDQIKQAKVDVITPTQLLKME